MTTPLRTARAPLSPAAVALALGGFGLVLGTGLGSSAGPVLCPFRLCTGQACPACGLTRASVQLLSGQFAASWRMHPLAGLLMVQVAVVTALRLSPVGRARWSRASGPVLLANALLLGLVWALRWRLGLLDVVVASG